MAKIFVMIPVLGRPEMNFMLSLFSAIESSSHTINICVEQGDSLLPRVRNVQMTAFLDKYKEYDYCAILDSDLEIMDCTKESNLFDKLISHNREFVGGLYANRGKSYTNCSSIALDQKTIKWDDGLKEMLWMGTGCWLLTRSAAEKMRDAYTDLHYLGDGSMARTKCYAMFNPLIKEVRLKDGEPKEDWQRRKYLSEDWAFCERWRAIGGKIWADTSINLAHIGTAKYYLWPKEAYEKK